MQNIQTKTNWIQLFKSDGLYGSNRFKWLGVNHPPFEIDDKLFDYVTKDDFIKIEKNRIPILLGSQFGIYPNIDKMPEFFNGTKLVAILGKSLLSGHVAGLSIYQIEAEDKRLFLFKKIAYYRN
jgi:hypothetical protein